MGGLLLCCVFLAEINEYPEDNLITALSHHLRENSVYRNKRGPITTQTVVPAGKEPARTSPFPVPYVFFRQHSPYPAEYCDRNYFDSSQLLRAKSEVRGECKWSPLYQHPKSC